MFCTLCCFQEGQEHNLEPVWNTTSAFKWFFLNAKRHSQPHWKKSCFHFVWLQQLTWLILERWFAVCLLFLQLLSRLLFRIIHTWCTHASRGKPVSSMFCLHHNYIFLSPLPTLRHCSMAHEKSTEYYESDFCQHPLDPPSPNTQCWFFHLE